MTEKRIRTLTSGRYVLAGAQVKVEVGRSCTVLHIGRLRFILDSALPQSGGRWLVRYKVGNNFEERVLEAAT